MIIELLPVVRDFVDVFQEELPKFPTRREVEFAIDMMPETSLTSIPSSAWHQLSMPDGRFN